MPIREKEKRVIILQMDVGFPTPFRDMNEARVALGELLDTISALNGRGRGIKRTITGKPPGAKKFKKGKPQTKKQRATKAGGRADGTKTKIKNQIKKRSKKRESLSLKKRIRKVEAKLKDDPPSTFTYKQDIGGTLSFDPGKCQYKVLDLWDPTAIEACIDAIPYVPVNAPSTTSTINATTVTTNQKIPMHVWAKVFFKNNRTMPVNMTVYVLEFKTTWSSGTGNPVQIFPELAADLQKGGLANAGSGDALINNPAFYPSDSTRWKRDLKVIETFKVRLDAGDEYEVSSGDKIQYNQELSDSEGASTKALFKYHRVIFFRVHGVVSHESAAPTTVGWSDGAVDYILRRVYKVLNIGDGLKTRHFEVSNANTLSVPVIAGADVVIEEEKSA